MRLTLAAAALLTVALAVPVLATPALAAKAPKVPKPDLADAAQGTYHGDVISDSRGSGRTDVTITVTKTGPNTVSVTSDYDRLPPFTAKLAKYMSTIQKTGAGSEVFLLDLAKNPKHLDVTDDQASWSGQPGE